MPLSHWFLQKIRWVCHFFIVCYIFFFFLIRNDLNCAALYVNLFSLYILEILEQARRIVRVCWGGISTNFALTFCLNGGIWLFRKYIKHNGLYTKPWTEEYGYGFYLWIKNYFSLYTLTSICIIAILFSIHFQGCWMGEFVW